MNPQTGLANVYESMNGLTTALNHILSAVKGGNANLQGAADALIASLVVLEILLMGYWFALGELGFVSALKKVLALGFWVWFAREFSSIAQWWADFASGSGLKAGGMPGSFSILKDPSNIANMAMKLTKPLVDYIMELDVTDVPLILLLCAAWWAILFIYLAMAINVFAAMLEFYVFAVLAAMLMPFGVSPFTRFIAEKGISIVVASGVKLMTLGFVLAIVKPTLGNMQISNAADLNQLVAIILTTGALAFLAWQAPRMAASVVGGSPSLSVGSVMGNAMAAYGTARMGWGLLSGGAVGSAVTRATTSAIEAAARLAPQPTVTSAPPAPPQEQRQQQHEQRQHEQRQHEQRQQQQEPQQQQPPQPPPPTTQPPQNPPPRTSETTT